MTLLGSTTDSLKLASCLTLFEVAARTLSQTEPSPELILLEKRCQEILAQIDAQGFPRCQATLDEIEPG